MNDIYPARKNRNNNKYQKIRIKKKRVGERKRAEFEDDFTYLSPSDPYIHNIRKFYLFISIFPSSSSSMFNLTSSGLGAMIKIKKKKIDCKMRFFFFLNLRSLPNLYMLTKVK